MIEKFVNRLNFLVAQSMVSGLDIKDDLEDEETKKGVERSEFIYVGALRDILTGLLNDFEREEREKRIREQKQNPYQKFMFVEDGSVDTDNLIEEMEMKNPEIKVVVYRQGAKKPEILDIGETK